MEKLHFETEVENEVVEAAFRERAGERLSQLGIPPFTASGMELARSEKEISKCISILERRQKRESAHSKKEQRKKKYSRKGQALGDKENYKKVFKRYAGRSTKNKT